MNIGILKPTGWHLLTNEGLAVGDPVFPLVDGYHTDGHFFVVGVNTDGPAATVLACTGWPSEPHTIKEFYQQEGLTWIRTDRGYSPAEKCFKLLLQKAEPPRNKAFLPFLFDLMAMGIPEYTSNRWHDTIWLIKSHAENMADCIEMQLGDNEALLESVMHFRKAMELILLTHVVKTSMPDAIKHDLFLPRFIDMIAIGIPKDTATRWDNAIFRLKSHAEHMAQCIAKQTGDKEALKEAAHNFREVMKTIRPTTLEKKDE